MTLAEAQRRRENVRAETRRRGEGGAMTTLTLPSRHEEAWRWSNLDALRALAEAPHGSFVDAQNHFIGLGGPRLVFVDGALDESASDPGRVSIEPLALATDHPLGKQATGPGWSLTLDTDRAADGFGDAASPLSGSLSEEESLSDECFDP